MNVIQNFERVQEEMKIAQHIQRSLIPTSVPSCAVADIAAYLCSSVELGGDFYDFYEPDENTLCMILGDVSGKGIPAALHMAEMKGIFQTLAQFKLPPRQFLEQANTAVSNCYQKNIFVTLVYIVVNRQAKTITYARAGHCPVIYYSAAMQAASCLKDEGLALGVLRNADFAKHVHIYERKMHPGDVYLFTTDGFEEALGVDTSDRYGIKRLLKSLEKADKGSANSTKNAILEDFEHYVKGQESLDDLGMIVLNVR